MGWAGDTTPSTSDVPLMVQRWAIAAFSMYLEEEEKRKDEKGMERKRKEEKDRERKKGRSEKNAGRRRQRGKERQKEV